MPQVFIHKDGHGRTLRAELGPRSSTASDPTPVVLITCDAPGERAVGHRLELDEFDVMVAAIRPAADA